MEFENAISVNARRRRRPPELMNFIDPSIDVLDTGIGEESWRCVCRPEVARRLKEDGNRVPGLEALGDLPGEHPSRKVVDHGLEIGAGPVEQADDGGRSKRSSAR